MISLFFIFLASNSQLKEITTFSIQKTYYEGYLSSRQKLSFLSPLDPYLLRKLTQKEAFFIEKILKAYENSNGQLNVPLNAQMNVPQNDPSDLGEEKLVDLFMKRVIEGFRLGVREDRLLLKLVRLVEKFPKILGESFKEAVEKDIPSWVFLKWVPQFLHLIRNPSLIDFFKPLFRNLARLYPQIISYHFNVFCDGEKEGEFMREMRGILEEGFPCCKDFIDSLNLLTHPEHRMEFHSRRIQSKKKNNQEGGRRRVGEKEEEVEGKGD